LQGTLGALEVFILVLLSMAFRVDDPETVYNESDTPINLAIPTAIDVAANVRPLVESRIIGTAVRGQRMDQGNSSMKFVTTVLRKSGLTPHLKLLFTLIC
jgi:hypothetical protein